MITDLLQIGKITFQFTLWITLQIHSLESDQIDYKFESIWLFIHFVGWNNEKSVCYSIIDRFNALFDEKKNDFIEEIRLRQRNSIRSEKFDSVENFQVKKVSVSSNWMNRFWPFHIFHQTITVEYHEFITETISWIHQNHL